MASGSYWCYSCSRFVLLPNPFAVTCPDCDGGFIEEIQSPPGFIRSDSFHRHQNHHRRSSGRRFPTSAMYTTSPASATATTNSSSVLRRTRRSGGSSGDRSPMNPVIVLRGSGPSDDSSSSDGRDRSGFQLYYDDGSDSGLRPLPPSMTEFLFGSGFDRFLDQISQIELTANRSNRACDHAPASKSAIESLPTVEIGSTHLESDSQSHCAVCKESFVLQSTARELPCKHIYHEDCILPWLSLRNSCPVCRHELPVEDNSGVEGGGDADVRDDDNNNNNNNNSQEEDATAGLTIWRLPGGGFAVGRIPGGRDRVMPVVYTEMDGGRFNEERLPRRVSWGSRGGSGGNGRERGGVGGGFAGRVLRNLFGCFSGSGSGSSSGFGSDSRGTRRSGSFTMFNTTSPRRRAWLL